MACTHTHETITPPSRICFLQPFQAPCCDHKRLTFFRLLSQRSAATIAAGGGCKFWCRNYCTLRSTPCRFSLDGSSINLRLWLPLQWCSRCCVALRGYYTVSHGRFKVITANSIAAAKCRSSGGTRVKTNASCNQSTVRLAHLYTSQYNLCKRTTQSKHAGWLHLNASSRPASIGSSRSKVLGCTAANGSASGRFSSVCKTLS